MTVRGGGTTRQGWGHDWQGWGHDWQGWGHDYFKKKQWTLARLCQIVFRTLLGDLTFNNLSEKTVAIFCTINL